nr:MAG TPA: hypothetical protein [Caudoviricetes sp.]
MIATLGMYMQSEIKVSSYYIAENIKAGIPM